MRERQQQTTNGHLFSDGEWVRLIGNPQRFGTFIDVVERAGRRFARVRFPTGVSLIPLDQLEPVPAAAEEPLDFLRTGRFSEPARLRQVLAHIRLTGRLADVIYSMESTNTEFHAHQFKPVLKMLSSPTGSLLIADEVGLGKTIEAGLIWTELKARFDYRRLLVICPKVLCHKWQAELSSKFGLDARVYSAEDLLMILNDRQRLEQGFIAICSLQGLRPPSSFEDEEAPLSQRFSAKLARLLLGRAEDEPFFDLLVVDEAHHLRNPDTQSNRLARLLQPLAQHQVFLSATPIHLRNRDLFSLLTLLDPTTFRSEVALAELLDANRPLIAAREAVLADQPIEDVRELVDCAGRHRLLADTQQVAAMLDELADLANPVGRPERARLAARLEQINLLANTINRTRRRDVQELRVVRQVAAHRAKMHPFEREAYDAISAVVRGYAELKEMPPGFLLATPQRLLASCLPAALDHWRSRTIDLEIEDEELVAEGDEAPATAAQPLVERLSVAALGLPAPSELEAFDSKFDKFRDSLGSFLGSAPGEKVVVFSTFRPTLRYLARRLANEGFAHAVIHGQTKDRTAVLANFAAADGPRILLSSEVGSEGIDLQFSRTMINYDLPWNPMRVEQRIGRIDRLGQTAPTISVINLLHEDTIDDRIYARLYERLRLCERALGGFEAILGEEIAKLTPELLKGDLSPEQEAARIEQTGQAIENRLRDEAHLEDEAAALIAHGDYVLQAIHAAHNLHRWVTTADLARYIEGALRTAFPGSRLLTLPKDDLFELRVTSDARIAYVEWLKRKKLPLGSPLARETGPVLCRLGRPAPNEVRRRIDETITQTHSFVRFLADRVAETDAPKLRPAIAARVLLADLPAGLALRPGRYAILAALWRFTGQLQQERIAYEGLALPGETLMADDDAERLMLAGAATSTAWPDADLELDCVALARRCKEVLDEHLASRFNDEERSIRAEQEDRVLIQLRTLEQRLREQRRPLEDTIDRQRRRIDDGSADAAKAGRALAMNEGKLRKLDERAAVRRQEIERARRQSSESEQLAVAVIEVVE